MGGKGRFLCMVFFWGMFFGTGELLQAREVQHHGSMVGNDNSRACLECHDGTLENMQCPNRNCFLESSSSHAVFKKYPPAGKEKEYQPASRVEAAGIKLEDDRVTCISCHDLTTGFRYHLVMINERSQLCKACHIR